MSAKRWNASYPVGTPVFAYPGFRPEDASDARRLVTRTRTAAQQSSSGDPVVWVEGEGSYIVLTHVDPVTEAEWEKARAAGDGGGRVNISPVYCPDTSCFWSVHGIPDVYAEARAYHLSSHRAEEHGEPLTAEQVAYAKRVGHPLPNSLDTAAEKHDGQPVDSAPSRTVLDRARHALTARMTNAGLRVALESVTAHAARLEAERHTTNEALSEAVEALHADPDQTAEAPPRDDDASDNRRRLYLDGKGTAWISLYHDDGTEWIVPVQGEVAIERDARHVADETGSLREIGRCW
ncbi:hypothetical protein [Streptomyces sp. SID8352]|uniref:hypothetical protein n=1 Tax=Streptomyces sp. SID8352 TaxID=2690338 RepID=UPI00136D989D|nr:hypothetical protein [Streptomyces sp. SID8352]MYU20759.1 hypothetical protein [Streptomyces sp. SID8352]